MASKFRVRCGSSEYADFQAANTKLYGPVIQLDPSQERTDSSYTRLTEFQRGDSETRSAKLFCEASAGQLLMVDL